MTVSVREADFDPGAEIESLSKLAEDAGAVVSFVGLVRGGTGSEAISAMTLEHYPGMTEKALDSIEQEARERWELLGVTIIHRIGKLLPGERIVLVVVASRHRGDAFVACEFIMDYLKTRAPFWKREDGVSGSRWVDARESDDVAVERWKKQ